MAWYWIVILCVASGWAGYILKDQLTDEFVSNVTIHKPKIKGGGEMDLVQDVQIDHKKLTWRERRDKRKKERQLKRAD